MEERIRRSFESKTKLLPCPFCGSKATTAKNYLGQCLVACQNDDCFAVIFGNTFESVIKKWNMREAIQRRD